MISAGMSQSAFYREKLAECVCVCLHDCTCQRASATTCASSRVHCMYKESVCMFVNLCEDQHVIYNLGSRTYVGSEVILAVPHF